MNTLVAGPIPNGTKEKKVDELVFKFFLQNYLLNRFVTVRVKTYSLSFSLLGEE